MQIVAKTTRRLPDTQRAFVQKSTTALVLFVSAMAISNLVYAGESTTLTPHKLTSPKGNIGSTGVGALEIKDQRGNNDNWNKYVEFYPSSSRHVSILNFEAPVSFVNQEIESLKVNVNYRGPTKAEQMWKWQILNYETRKWISLGDNAGALNWRWTELAYTARGDASDYVSILGTSRLRYSSTKATDNSNLDSVSIQMSLADSTEEPPVDPPEGEIWSPSPGTSWQWQLTGAIDTSYSVDMYDIDLFDVPQSVINGLQARNIAVVCYFSAGSYENWRPDAGSFPSSVLGANNGWAGEKWLDIRAIDALAPIMFARLDLAVAKGCDAVEPDNIDGYANRSGFPLSAQDQLNYNKWLADAAHARGLSIGLKNDLDQVVALEPWFDWALNEQCVQYNECDLLTPFVEAGKAVFGVEYSGNAGQICSTTNSLDFDWLIKDLDLGAERQSCR